jgi:hypothetical protein
MRKSRLLDTNKSRIDGFIPSTSDQSQLIGVIEAFGVLGPTFCPVIEATGAAFDVKQVFGAEAI